MNKLSVISLTSSPSLVRIKAMNNELTSYTSSNDTPGLSTLSNVDLSYAFQFWFSLSFHIPSIICYLFVLTHILTKKTQRQALHNHSILVLLFIAFTIVIFDYSWTIDSCRHGGKVWLQTSAFCEV
jgi:hypothetical protein